MKEHFQAMMDRVVPDHSPLIRWQRAAQRGLLMAMLLLLAQLLFVPGAASGPGDAEVPVKVRIAKHLNVFPPQIQLNPGLGEDGGQPKSAPERIVVETNDPTWMLTVGFRLPDAQARFELPGRWTCALLDAQGELISEVFVKQGLAVLPGNGLCGRHEVQLRLSRPADVQAAPLPAGLVVELSGEDAIAVRR